MQEKENVEKKEIQEENTKNTIEGNEEYIKKEVDKRVQGYIDSENRKKSKERTEKNIREEKERKSANERIADLENKLQEKELVENAIKLISKYPNLSIDVINGINIRGDVENQLKILDEAIKKGIDAQLGKQESTTAPSLEGESDKKVLSEDNSNYKALLNGVN